MQSNEYRLSLDVSISLGKKKMKKKICFLKRLCVLVVVDAQMGKLGPTFAPS